MTRDETLQLFLECEAKRRQARAAGKDVDEAHDEAKAHWNAWAEGMLAHRKAMEADGTWLTKSESAETHDWYSCAKVDFSSCVFLNEGIPAKKEEAQAEAALEKESAKAQHGVKLIALDSQTTRLDGFIFPSKADFGNAEFTGRARFDNASFLGPASFGSFFNRDTRFDGTNFYATARYDAAIFGGDVFFYDANVKGKVSFKDVSFKGLARFDSAKFEGTASFDNTIFDREARFDSALFEGRTFFVKADFREQTSFRGASFKGIASFASTIFKKALRFDDAIFVGPAFFARAVFKGQTSFDSANFVGTASFDFTIFERDARFDSAHFEGTTSFAEADFKRLTSFGNATFSGLTSFAEAVFNRATSFTGAAFKSDVWFNSTTFEGAVQFEKAVFEGNAGFNNATFKGYASFGEFEGVLDFGRAHFVEAPRFGNADLLAKAEIPKAPASEVQELTQAINRLEERVDHLQMNPALDNFQGQIYARFCSENGSKLTIEKAGKDGSGKVVIARPLEQCFAILTISGTGALADEAFREEIKITGGNDSAKLVTFFVSAEAEDFQFQPAYHIITFEKNSEPEARFDFRAPEAPGLYKIYFEVSQKNRLIQVLPTLLMVQKV